MLRLQYTRHDRRAKDGEIEMSLGISRAVVGVERVVGGGVARPQSLAAAGAAGRHPVCQRPTHGHHLAPHGGRQRRLPGLFLLSGGDRTQERIDCDSTGSTPAADLVPAPASAVGDRRLAHQAIWAQGRRGRCASQPDAGPGRFAVSVWPCLGDDLVGPAASEVGSDWRGRCGRCFMFASRP